MLTIFVYSATRAFGGLIAFGIGHITNGVPNWKWLFLIEALPCFCLGLFCLYWLPDRPMSNSRFSGIDQEIAEARYKSESFDKAGKIQKKHLIWTVTDWRLYAQAAIYLPTAALLSSISGFLPSIISGTRIPYINWLFLTQLYPTVLLLPPVLIKVLGMF